MKEKIRFLVVVVCLLGLFLVGIVGFTKVNNNKAMREYLAKIESLNEKLNLEEVDTNLGTEKSDDLLFVVQEDSEKEFIYYFVMSNGTCSRLTMPISTSLDDAVKAVKNGDNVTIKTLLNMEYIQDLYENNSLDNITYVEMPTIIDIYGTLTFYRCQATNIYSYGNTLNVPLEFDELYYVLAYIPKLFDKG